MLNKKIKIITLVVIFAMLSGCATTNTIAVVDERDPWENWNRKMHSLNESIDEVVVKPGAQFYLWLVPDFVDVAVTNVFSNIDDIGVFINDALQGKFAQSGLDFSRFLVNTTAGLGGLIDVATMVDLEKHNEDFGQTLGYWGIPTGPYMVLPFLGPSSPRGVAGLIGDAAMDPTSYFALYIPGTTFYISASTYLVHSVDTRAELMDAEAMADEAAAFGKYEFYRDSYISNRQFLVTDGVESEEDELLLLDDEE